MQCSFPIHPSLRSPRCAWLHGAYQAAIFCVSLMCAEHSTCQSDLQMQRRCQRPLMSNSNCAQAFETNNDKVMSCKTLMTCMQIASQLLYPQLSACAIIMLASL